MREEQVPGELLGDRAAALRRVPTPQIREHSAGHSGRLDSPMLVEAAVLDGDDRVDQRLRKLVQPGEKPILGEEISQ